VLHIVNDRVSGDSSNIWNADVSAVAIRKAKPPTKHVSIIFTLQASSRWLSTSDDVCKVTDDSKNFVDCECHHMSLFAARGPTDNLAGYNEVRLQ